MHIFEASSGHKVSVEKTRIYFSKNVCHARSLDIANEFGFTITGDLGKYLSVPLQYKQASSKFFSHITDKIMRTRSAWKANSLSLAGRLTLCSSVLNAMPTYAMQIAFLPSPVCNQIDSLCCCFLWGAVDQRKVHLCRWDQVCHPKLSGGLGLRFASSYNLAFLTKIG